MKNKITVIALMSLMLLGGCGVDKKESNESKQEVQQMVEEVKEEPKEEKKVVEKKTTATKKKKTTKSTTTTTKKVSYNVGELQSYAHSLVLSYGWTEYDYECLIKLWNRESGWNPNAVNKKSGACGIPQSLPCKKMASEGSDYKTNGKTQIKWGLKYIKNRYGSPSQAWAHSQAKGWY